jgi:riboflavin synthase alpha subunit
MFTGIIKALGHVAESSPGPAGRTMVIEADAIAEFSLNEGDSVAVNGVCLTHCNRAQRTLPPMSRTKP